MAFREMYTIADDAQYIIWYLHSAYLPTSSSRL